MDSGWCLHATCTSAASAWGSQKVMSMVRYRALNAACVRLPPGSGCSWHGEPLML